LLRGGGQPCPSPHATLYNNSSHPQLTMLATSGSSGLGCSSSSYIAERTVRNHPDHHVRAHRSIRGRGSQTQSRRTHSGTSWSMVSTVPSLASRCRCCSRRSRSGSDSASCLHDWVTDGKEHSLAIAIYVWVVYLGREKQLQSRTFDRSNHTPNQLSRLHDSPIPQLRP
jgi:hypothetical protein